MIRILRFTLLQAHNRALLTSYVVHYIAQSDLSDNWKLATFWPFIPFPPSSTPHLLNPHSVRYLKVGLYYFLNVSYEFSSKEVKPPGPRIILVRIESGIKFIPFYRVFRFSISSGVHLVIFAYQEICLFYLLNLNYWHEFAHNIF